MESTGSPVNTNPLTSPFARLLDANGASLFTTENGALDVSIDSLLFWEQVDGNAVNTNTWNQSVSGMTIAQTNGFLTLNAGSALTAGAYAILSSIKNINLYGHLPVRMTMNARIPVSPAPNFTIELGLGQVATNAAPSDGAFFRWAAGALACVMNFAGVETVSASIPAPPTTEVALFDIVCVEDAINYYIDDNLVATIDVPVGQAYPVSAGHQPVFGRIYNGGSSPANAPQINIGQVVVVQEALNQNRLWRECAAIMGRGCYQSPITAFGQTANHANSTSPASATLSNTAAGYATLGGRFQFAAPAGAATDFALFAFQVPSLYQLIITAVEISMVNLGAGVLLSPTVVDWSLGLNSSAVSLATADGAGTWAPRRIPIGMQAFLIGDLIGKLANDVVRNFDPPLVVDSGRFFHVIAQIPFGTATIGQILRGDVTVVGYFE